MKKLISVMLVVLMLVLLAVAMVGCSNSVIEELELIVGLWSCFCDVCRSFSLSGGDQIEFFSDGTGVLRYYSGDEPYPFEWKITDGYLFLNGYNVGEPNLSSNRVYIEGEAFVRLR